MSIVLVSRARRKLRKPPVSKSDPKDLDSESRQETLGSDDLDGRLDEDRGVVRVSYTIRPRHAELISNILVAIRKATGSACNASDVVRLALDELAKLPTERTIEILAQMESVKRGRRS